MISEPVSVVAGTRHSALLVEADRSDDPLIQCLTIAGELDAAGSLQLHRGVLALLRRHRPRVIEINTLGLISVDGAGLQALLLCREDARQMGCRLILTDPHPGTRRALRDAGLAQSFGQPR